MKSRQQKRLIATLIFILFHLNPSTEQDTISEIQVQNTSIIILTDINGDVDGLTVGIDLTELKTAKIQSTVNLTADSHQLRNRGRYKLTNLTPNTWYGLSFRSEKKSGTSTKMHYEDRIVRTLGEGGADEDENEDENKDKNEEEKDSSHDSFAMNIYQVVATAVGRPGQLVVHVQKDKNSLFLQLIVKTSLFCDEKVHKKDLNIPANLAEGSVKYELKHAYELKMENDGSSDVTVTLTPENCTKLCYTPWLRSVKTNNGVYSMQYNETCETLSSLNMTTALRRFIGFEATNNSATAITLFNTSEHEEDQNSYVQLMALHIKIDQSTSKKNNNKNANVNGIQETENYKTMNISAANSTNGKFTIENLPANQWHAITYTYWPRTPFDYEDVQHFAVFTQNDDQTKMEMDIGAGNLTGINGVHLWIEKDNNNDDGQKWKVWAMRGNDLHGKEVSLSVLPFCTENGLKTRLGDKNWHQPLNGIDPTLALCLANLTMCNDTILGPPPPPPPKNGKNDINQTQIWMEAIRADAEQKHSCEKLCYRFEMPIRGKNEIVQWYELRSDCIHFAEFFAKTFKQSYNSGGKLAPILRLLMLLVTFATTGFTFYLF